MIYSPLRYPGGKRLLTKHLVEILNTNGPIDNYIEPFAGGAGAALSLLLNGHVKKIFLNDFDNFIYNFWKSLIHKKTNFIKLIRNEKISITQYKRHKEILKKNKNVTDIQKGFTTLYLNRCNRSGILNAGPIGGFEQNGKWKINARFNKKNIIERIETIHLKRKDINIFNEDAIDFLRNVLPTLNLDMTKTMIYLDPPYYEQGPSLYRTFYNTTQHIELKEYLTNELNVKWILSYDDVPFINSLYNGTRINGIRKNHFANKTKLGREIIIVSDNCKVKDNNFE